MTSIVSSGSDSDWDAEATGAPPINVSNLPVDDAGEGKFRLGWERAQRQLISLLHRWKQAAVEWAWGFPPRVGNHSSNV